MLLSHTYDRWTCMTDGYATKNAHEPFFSNSVSAQLMHDHSSKHMSHMIMHNNQPTIKTIANAHNNSITWGNQSFHDLAKMLARSPNSQDHGHDPPMWDLTVHSLFKFYVGGILTPSPTSQNEKIG